MSSNEIRKWLNLVESKSTLNEYAAGGGGGGDGRRGGHLAYYHSTISFIKHYEKDRKGEPELGADDLESDVKWLKSVADGFLQGMKQGLKAFFRIDTMLQDMLQDELAG